MGSNEKLYNFEPTVDHLDSHTPVIKTWCSLSFSQGNRVKIQVRFGNNTIPATDSILRLCVWLVVSVERGFGCLRVLFWIRDLQNKNCFSHTSNCSNIPTVFKWRRHKRLSCVGIWGIEQNTFDGIVSLWIHIITVDTALSQDTIMQ